MARLLFLAVVGLLLFLMLRATIAAFLTLLGLLFSDLLYALVNPTISLEAQ